jgi:hypothetical protein
MSRVKVRVFLDSRKISEFKSNTEEETDQKVEVIRNNSIPKNKRTGLTGPAKTKNDIGRVYRIEFWSTGYCSEYDYRPKVSDKAKKNYYSSGRKEFCCPVSLDT